MIRQGDVRWIDFGTPRGAAPGYRRPCVVVQNDVYNQSRISTVVVAVITTNLKRAQAFGNVALRKGEAGLPRGGVVNISQLATVDRAILGERVGRLQGRRFDQVLTGIHGLLTPLSS